MENGKSIRSFTPDELNLPVNKWRKILLEIIQTLNGEEKFAGYYVGIDKEETIKTRARFAPHLIELAKNDAKKIYTSMRFIEPDTENEDVPQRGYWIIFSYEKMPKARNSSKK